MDDKTGAPTQKVYVAMKGENVILGTQDGEYVFSPAVAVEIANTMLEAVKRLGHQVVVEHAPRQITDQQRANLITRCGHVVRSLNNKKPLYIAQQVVDTVLAEIL